MEHGNLLRPEVRRDLHRFAAQGRVERVGQGVGGIGAHDDGAVAEASKPQGRRSGDAGLAYPTFTRVQDNTHSSFFYKGAKGQGYKRSRGGRGRLSRLPTLPTGC